MNPIRKVFDISDLNTIILEYAYTPKKYIVYENYGDSLQDCLSKGHEHDTVYYCTNNQLGCLMYEIKVDNDKKKYLHTIWAAEDDYYYESLESY